MHNMNTDKSYFRERREWLKSRGFCVDCGKNKAEPNRVRCFECAEKANRRSSAKYHENIEARREQSKQRYQERKDQGICVRCSRPAEKGKVMCSVCLAQQRIKDEKKRRENGLLPMWMRGDGYHCAICGKDTSKAGDKLCPVCLERNLKLAENMRKSVDSSKHRWNKYNQQLFHKEKA